MRLLLGLLALLLVAGSLAVEPATGRGSRPQGWQPRSLQALAAVVRRCSWPWSSADAGHESLPNPSISLRAARRSAAPTATATDRNEISRVHSAQKLFAAQPRGSGAGLSKQVGRQRWSPARSLLSSHAAATLAPEAGEAALEAWSRETTAAWQPHGGGSCFEDYAFVARDISDLVRLLKDPAASHIDLRGDITFTHELFPPENANNQAKGLNITAERRVEIRACTGAASPITVDVNHLQQQVYVYGRLKWAGSIRFINPFPSPRRGGMFPLISVLSVEGDGVVSFQDLAIQGNEPSPLFNENDPYWQVYRNDAAFSPQPKQYTRLSDSQLIMHEWIFDKTAWVLKSQGANGVVVAQGAAYWNWTNVLISWSPAPAASSGSSGLSGPALAAAIAVPTAVGLASLCLLAGFLACRWRTRRREAAGKAGGGPADAPASASRAGPEPDALSKLQPSGSQQPTSSAAGWAVDQLARTAPSGSKASLGSLGTQEAIEQVRRRMAETGSAGDATITLEGLLGEGTFGKVYRGHWQGTLVAVKLMLFPAAMSGKEKREKMAIMETAISSSLSHPNVVQTYTYVVRPLTGELAMQALEAGPKSVMHGASGSCGSERGSRGDSEEPSDSHGWEVRLVLELCDRGSLRDLLSAGGFVGPAGEHDMQAVVATALDVARAMVFLHSSNIIHSDLKARNVLLKSAGADARGFVAKVADFGLAVRMDPSETHVSNVYQGTLTHMAPELLIAGKISKASDVYAFGILLWELYTGQQAFKGTPRVLLGHEVTKLGRRPQFPPGCPFDFQLLACRCWESDPTIRPPFEAILTELQRMAAKLAAAAAATGGDGAGACGYAASPGPLGARPGAPLAAAGLAARAQQLDPAAIPPWEPQTSLLDLEGPLTATSLGRPSGEQPLAVAAAVAGARAARGAGPTPQQQHQQQQPDAAAPCALSWGDGHSGAGLWLGGDFAPSGLLPGDGMLLGASDPAAGLGLQQHPGLAPGAAQPPQLPPQQAAQQAAQCAGSSQMPGSAAQSSSHARALSSTQLSSTESGGVQARQQQRQQQQRQQQQPQQPQQPQLQQPQLQQLQGSKLVVLSDLTDSASGTSGRWANSCGSREQGGAAHGASAPAAGPLAPGAAPVGDTPGVARQ